MPDNQYASFSNPLRGFEEADTSSQSQGFVPAGSYLVKEIRENYPNTDSDYVHIIVPSMGDEDTWICSRWKDKRYAVIETKATEVAVPSDFSAEDLAINESFLTDLMPQFYDFSYDLDQARYPFELTGFRTPLAPPHTNNCCTFVEALVVKAWENAAPGFTWSMDNHKQMMIFSADDYFSPVTCLVSEEIAEPVSNADQAPHPWTVIQGWRKQWRGGHTFIILDYHPETDRVLTLESNSAFNLNGVGFRMIGNVKNHPNPGSDWWQNDALWTWERIKSVYQFRKQCILKVNNRNWV